MLVSCIIIATTIFRRAMWSVLSPRVPAAAAPKSYTRAARLDRLPWRRTIGSRPREFAPSPARRAAFAKFPPTVPIEVLTRMIGLAVVLGLSLTLASLATQSHSLTDGASGNT